MKVCDVHHDVSCRVEIARSIVARERTKMERVPRRRRVTCFPDPTSGIRTKRCRPRDLVLSVRPASSSSKARCGSPGRGTLAHASTRRTTPTRKHTGARSLASVSVSPRVSVSSLATRRAAPRRRSAFQILARARVPTWRFKKPRGARSEIARLTPSPHPRSPPRHAGWTPPPPPPA